MYCKKCGKEIPDDSKFCNFCGTQQNKPLAIKENGLTPTEQAIKDEDHSEKAFHGCLITFFCLIFVILLTVGLILGIRACNDQPTVNIRNATTSDISITQDNDISFSYNFNVTPKSNIRNLQLELEFYDSDNTVRFRKNVNLGNVEKNKPYRFSVTLSEIGYSSAFGVSYYKVKVTGGTVY